MPRRVVWIEGAGGTRLCGDLYLPDGDGPFAPLLEALPYRKDDVTASYRPSYERFVAAGFAVCRLDLRGTGSSGGVATDEYPDVERADLRATIEWLATRPWSSGRVGMFGTSYSGFNALHMAADGVPQLGAIVAAYATDDRFTDDVHYGGGVLRAVDLIDYVLYMVAMNALPPVPALWGDGWRDEWRRRIEDTPPWLLGWLRDQVDGPGWRRGSIRVGPDGAGYERVACPTMLVAGWADGYRNNTFRTVEQLDVPWRLLAGPWSHKDPAVSRPGPNIDVDVDVIAFFDEHLRSGPPSTDAPAQIFVRRPTRPEPDLAVHDGVWRDVDRWPHPGLEWRELPAGGSGVDRLDVRGDVGVAAWISCAGALPWGQPSDQRVDDARSLTYDWPVGGDGPAPGEVLGNPRAALRIRSSAPVAHVAVKLCDVFPDGTSALITRGMLNLTHRGVWPADARGTAGRAPEPLVPGEWVDVEVELEATTWTLVDGHVLRLTVAGSDWPNFWPPPTPVTLELDRSAVVLVVPVVAGLPESAHRFAPGRGPSPDDGDGVVWRVEHDVLGRETRVVTRYGGPYEGTYGARVTDEYNGTVGVSTTDPSAAWAKGRSSFAITWPLDEGGGEVTCATAATLGVRSDAEHYHVDVQLDATIDGEPFGARRWTESIPRRLQ
jgi:predicted acyl esterase